ncbi:MULTISPECIES: hypothetical protein [Actinomyces]|nr:MULTISPECIES: hypothetical protein [Actinomyces]
MSGTAVPQADDVAPAGCSPSSRSADDVAPAGWVPHPGRPVAVGR